MSEHRDLTMPYWFVEPEVGPIVFLLSFKTEYHRDGSEKTCACAIESRGVLVSDLLSGEDPDCAVDPADFWRYNFGL